MKKLSGFLVALTAAFVLLFAGCSNPSGGGGSSPLNETGRLTVTIGVEGREVSRDAARTVYPDFTPDPFGKYEVSFAATSGGAAHAPALVTGGSVTVSDLVVGTYAITARAYTGSEGSWTEAAVKEVTGVAISAGNNGAQTLILEPKIGGGNGTFSYAITLGQGIAGNLYVTTEDDQAVTGGTIALSSGANNSTLALAAGVYKLRAQVAKGNKKGGVTEILHIYPGLISALTKTYNESDLADVGASQAVSAFELTGFFAAPVKDAVPTTAFSGDQYTGAIAWSGGSFRGLHSLHRHGYADGKAGLHV
jgi:hypothetical protein